jgi:NAD(P)H-dependent FMN reductase
MAKRILCIVANPDTRAGSFSSSVSRAFLDELRAAQSDYEIKEANIYETHLPALDFNSNNGLDPTDENLTESNLLLEQINEADALVFISQTIGFGIPGQLKSLIEVLVATKNTDKLANKKGLHVQIEDDTLVPVFQLKEHDFLRNFLKECSVEMMETCALRHLHQEKSEPDNFLLELIRDTREAAQEFSRFLS